MFVGELSLCVCADADSICPNYFDMIIVLVSSDVEFSLHTMLLETFYFQ
jgi:hypothetical protein